MNANRIITSIPIRYQLALIGALIIVAATTATSQAAETVREGKQVYDASCVACHAAGVLQAPRTGNKEDWGEREKQGQQRCYCLSKPPPRKP